MDREGYCDTEYVIAHCCAFTGEDIEKVMVDAVNFVLRGDEDIP